MSIRFCSCDEIHGQLHYKIQKLLNGLSLSSRSRMLDVGCWDGVKSFDYGKAIGLDKKNIYGLEIVEDQIEKASKRINCLKTDLEADNFSVDDEFFDVVVANQVFEHLKNIYTPISEIYRVLKVGGYLIFSVPNLSSLHNRVLMMLGFQPTSIRIIGPHVRGFSYIGTKNFLEFNEHFEVVKKTGVGFYPSFYPLTGLLEKFVGLSHTVIWVAKKKKTKLNNWMEEINSFDSIDMQTEF